MNFDWYNIFNKTEFEALGVPSKEYEVSLEGRGVETVLATQGNELSVLFDDVFLTVNFNGNNPFVFEDRAVYLDENNDVHVGVLLED